MKRNHTASQQPERETTPPAFIAWHVAERRDRKFWTRIGAAWNHEDGEGLTLQLDLMPITTGRIVLRAPKPDDDQP